MKKLDTLLIDDTPYETEIPDNFMSKRFMGMPSPLEIRAVISGTVVEVKVKKGEQVAPGQVILILEAMKMYNDVQTEIGGRIAEIFVSPGDRIRKNQVLVRIGEVSWGGCP